MERDYSLALDISFEELVEAVNKLPKHQREDFIEDLLAATSPEYLESISEARDDYKSGKTAGHDEVFGDK